MMSGKELLLRAGIKELKTLKARHLKIKADIDEYSGIYKEMIAIREEFAVIVKSREHSKDSLEALEKLQARSDYCEKVRKRDLLKMTDRASNLSFEIDSLKSELNIIEYGINR